MDPYKYIELIKSKKDFIEFLKKLRKDKIEEDEKEKLNSKLQYSQGRNGWQNETIVDFLEAIIAYGEDDSKKDDPPNWKDFAELLYAGKIYE